MNKQECRKAIRERIEKILEGLSDILMHLRTNEGTEFSEMRSLVLAKQKAIDLTEQCARIFQHLVELRYYHLAEHKEHRSRENSVPNNAFTGEALCMSHGYAAPTAYLEDQPSGKEGQS
ncbi:hypothetical protein PAPHI01_0515 [Pancytospora philotis]|nr:hypothetical protein PAPHI01_0515 [Pancytospora philotis]